MALAMVEGPSWAPHDLEIRAGRFPLSVEPHLLSMTAKLVPGATTVTINARYYGIHGLVAAEARQRGLTTEATLELLRRAEVVVAGASVVHPSPLDLVAHGHDVVKPRLLDDGVLEVADIAQPGGRGYGKATTGYLGPYVGSEITLGILADTMLRPGPRLNEDALRDGFRDLLRLAEQAEVTVEELTRASHLSIGAAATSTDGPWLRGRLMAQDVSEPSKSDVTRRATILLLSRAVDQHRSRSFSGAFRAAFAYGPFARDDSVACALDETWAWRGTLLRHTSVGAWRELWAWLVDVVASHPGVMSLDELGTRIATELPDVSVRSFVNGLPATTDGEGDPAPAELEIEAERRSGDRSLPEACLGVLALGGIRSTELDGRVSDAFNGRRHTVLGPEWTALRFKSGEGQRLPLFARDLTKDLVERSQRIAMKKLRVGRDGRLQVFTRLHEKGGFLHATSREGSGNVGLRIDQLGGILAALGVFDRDADANWVTTDDGRAALD